MKKIGYWLLFLGLMVVSASCGDDEPTEIPSVFINSTSGLEGDNGTTNFTFIVKLTASTTVDVTVNYATANGTATAGEDYEAASGTVTIAAGATEAMVDVTIMGDETFEEDETFEVALSNANNAEIIGTAGMGTIRNDDTEPFDDAGYSTPDNYPNMTLVWADEFDGTGLNTSDWNYETGNHGWGNNELQNYLSGTSNATVADGRLTIEAKNAGGTYTSARLTTQGKQFFKYGRVDIRAKLPYGQGIWPALWMLGENFSTIGWPHCGEIDIMELVGHQPARVYGTIHWDDDGSHANYGGNKSLGAGIFADEFHVFTIIWNDQEIKWYLDDQLYHTADITPAGLSEFHNDFFFIFNIAVGGNWPGSPDGTTVFPQKMIVDYIRMFQ